MSAFLKETETSLNQKSISDILTIDYGTRNIFRVDLKLPLGAAYRAIDHRSVWEGRTTGALSKTNADGCSNARFLPRCSIFVNFGAIGNALSLSHCRTTSPLFAPHVVVPFYFYESRKNPEAACALNSLKYGYMLNDLESQKYEAARCHSVKEKVVLL